MKSVPKTCLERKPTYKTVYLLGKAINLHAISRVTDISPAQLSRILSGRCDPSLSYAARIADALSMSLGDFVEALQERRIADVLEQSGIGDIQAVA